jgi:hypothetical protein
MPDETGAITAGLDDVSAAGGTPVLSDRAKMLAVGATSQPNFGSVSGAPPDAPDIGGGPSAPDAALGSAPGIQPATPSAPTQHPTFFRQLLFHLGKGLVEGTKAGLQAQMGPQGPSEAARIAIAAPQQRREQLTTNMLNDMNVAMTQLKLHQLHMVVNQMEDDQQNGVYNRGRDTLDALMEKGKADVLATGDLKSVQDEFARRQADAKQAGQGLLPIQILPSVGSSAKDPKYSLVMVGKDKLTDDMDETWGAGDLGISKEDFDKAGLTQFKFHASAGMDQQKALQLKTTQYLNWITKSMNQYGQWKRNEASISGRATEGKANRDVRMKIADLNNLTRRAIADKKAVDPNDKLKVSALGKLISASKNFGDAQGKIGNKAWSALTDGEARELTTKRAALEEAQKTWKEVQNKSAAASALSPQRAKVPKGTALTKPIADQYKLLAGGDKAKAQQMAAEDGYSWPGAKQ